MEKDREEFLKRKLAYLEARIYRLAAEMEQIDFERKKYSDLLNDGLLEELIIIRSNGEKK